MTLKSRKNIFAFFILAILGFDRPAAAIVRWTRISPDTLVMSFDGRDRESVLLLTDDERIQNVRSSVTSSQSRTYDIALGVDRDSLAYESDFETAGFDLTSIGNWEGRHVLMLRPPKIQTASTCVLTYSGRCEVVNDSLKIVILQSLATRGGRLQKRTASISLPDKGRLKIWVSREGIHRLFQSQIETAGWHLSQSDIEHLRMVGPEGRSIPIRIVGIEDGSFDKKDWIEFWVDPIFDNSHADGPRLNTWSRDAVYWLMADDAPGPRMTDQGGLAGNSSFEELISKYYLSRKHVEEDRVFDRLPYARDTDVSDYWLYSSGIPDGEKWETTFKLDAPDTSAPVPATLRIRLRVQTVDPLDQAERPVEIFLNEKRVGRFSLPSMRAAVWTTEAFDPSVLKEGKNSFTLINAYSGSMTSRVFLDWFEVNYPHSYTAVNNIIRFKPPDHSGGMKYRFQIEGFTNPNIEVYRIGVGRMTAGTIDAVTDSLKRVTYRIQFDDFITDSDAEYVALAQSAKCAVDSAVWRPSPAWINNDQGADYLVITPGDSLWSDTAAPLIQLREKQGLHAGVFDANEIFDAFSGGIPDPEGLRLFFQYARDHWTIQPRFVVLAGSGILNARLGPESGNLIPAPLYPTYKYGCAPADNFYTLLDDDLYPDLAIGRLPVRTRREFQSVVSKIVGYEACPPASWMNQYLLISSDAPGGVFSNQTETMIHESLPPVLHPERLLLLGPAVNPNVGGTESLLRHFSDGMAMINYRGHGGGAVWADLGVLKLEDVQRIENTGRLPFITSMTCFTGDYSISTQSLGVALLMAEGKGAAGFWGSTGVGWTYTDYDLLIDFYRELRYSPNLTIGEWIQRAKTDFLFENSGDIPISDVYQYTLLGDPAMRLNIPRESVKSTTNGRAFEAGDTLLVSGTVESAGTQGTMEITDRSFTAITQSNIEIGTNLWKSQFVFPSNFSEPDPGIRIHLWNESTGYQANGFTPLRFGQIYFDSLKTIPGNPGSKDSLGFSVWIEDRQTPLHVSINVLSPIDRILELEPESPGSARYITSNRIGPFPAGTPIRFFAEGLRPSGMISRSDTVSSAIRIQDLAVQSSGLSGDSCVEWTAHIAVTGFDDGVSIPVRFERDGSPPILQPAVIHAGLGEAIVAVEPGPGILKGKVTVNPDLAFQDDDRMNDQIEVSIPFDRFNVTPSGSQWAGRTDTIRFNDGLACWVPPGSVEKSIVVILASGDSISLPALSQGVGPLFSIRFSGQNPAVLKTPMTLFFSTYADSTEKLSPFRWNRDNNRWIIMPCRRETGRLAADTRESGEYRLAVSTDDRPPRINVLSEGRELSDGMYVSRNPTFSILIEDESGVDKRPGQVQVLLDEKSAQYVLSDTASNPNRLMFDLIPGLVSGEHSVEVTAMDVNGNQSRFGPTRFQIAADFELQFLGNHPNPFNPGREATVFAYFLTDAAKKVLLTIYTVSGRRIKNFESADMTAADYHEVEWDGRDQWGSEVANGVYFFRLQADCGLDRREITGKIAIIR